MIAFLMGTRFGRFIAWALAGVAFVWAAWVAGKREGRSTARSEAQTAELKAKVKTLERINEADTSTGDDAADRAWLRNRGLRGIAKRDSHL